MPQTPRIICHRGTCLEAPENTIVSGHRAIAMGGDWIELDIRQSRDGVLYVLHDETVDRTTNGTGPLTDMVSTDIDQLDAGSWFDPAFAGTTLPRLEPFLAELSGVAGGFYLEVKQADCAAIAAVVDRLGLADRCMTCSFDPQMRQDMARHAPDVAQMVHRASGDSIDDLATRHGAAIVEFFAETLNAEEVAECKERGICTQLWTDRDDPVLFQQAIDLGLDFVNIDHIQQFKALRDGR
ncbi:glycerophosphoryl diester phosphodiesterase [Jannaschia pagri]|uniref:Glycerophosphoryl diester phosphodiesterase n=1 Tax=Jannaschia pagri TaxID=2829797 RepID=A0ABQ4NNM7_9RHOB|nr:MULTISPECIES: glycerophosphodiester phosphodiesterase family protein [unclassified Jannaschia]GIT91878.1 glycerophosphoryl diester phosphodiesterase [Jannaschia sp. AI_61]GIT95712.1 glycerophosphoryl diester phosphodiesterase [Jannaschia sp. AI_62]